MSRGEIMTTEKKSKAFFTLNLPRRPRDGDKIVVHARLRKNPNEFRLILGVRAVQDRNSSIEPTMAALEFKTLFHSAEEIKVTTNWKTDKGWQDEEVVDSDWIDSKGQVNLTLTFERNFVLITEAGNSLVSRFQLNFELERINRLQLWGNIKELHEISLKYNQGTKPHRSSRKKSNSS